MGWLVVGEWVCWWVGALGGWLVSRSVCRVVGWLVDWLVGWLVCWLAGYLVACLSSVIAFLIEFCKRSIFLVPFSCLVFRYTYIFQQ